jgi:transaldolase/glucose-6-phosphate isomerase
VGGRRSGEGGGDARRQTGRVSLAIHMENRLGWTHAVPGSLDRWPVWTRFAAAVHGEGLDRVLVCGMGGSTLAPAVLARSFGVAGLDVLDSTDPAAVADAERRYPMMRTLFLIVSKSGSTVETMAAYRYFSARARPAQFVAVTDPGSPLERLAHEHGFREVFEHPPDVGGRYAALTVVGMLPAALAGIDGAALLERARDTDIAAARGLGAEIAQAAAAGRNKVALRPPAPLASLAAWIEQLLAESSGKNGRGVLPIVGDDGFDGPDLQVVSEFSADPLDLGREFLRWEYATWELCDRLGVDAFDQPDVEEAKALARRELAAAPGKAEDTPRTLTPEELRAAARPGDYLAVLAYLPPRPDLESMLQQTRRAWRHALGVATTAAFGPRYLHSTGQLHKGGPNTGLYLVVTADPTVDIEVPEMGTTFGRLERAQAIGDVRALLGRGRRVCHVHLERPEDLARLARM